MPVQKLREIADQVLQPKALAESERIVFASQLIADHAEMCRQQSGHGPQQFEPARQSGYDNKRRPLAPFPVIHRVMTQVRTARTADSRAELCSCRCQPLRGRSHFVFSSSAILSSCSSRYFRFLDGGRPLKSKAFGIPKESRVRNATPIHDSNVQVIVN